MKRIISTLKAPPALGPYSQAVVTNGTVYLSGQIGMTSEGKFACESVTGQAEQALKNMGEVLKSAGSSYDGVVKTTILLKNMDDFKAVNEVYAKYFTEGSYPARACYAAAALPAGALVEIEAIAVLTQLSVDK